MLNKEEALSVWPASLRTCQRTAAPADAQTLDRLCAILDRDGNGVVDFNVLAVRKMMWFTSLELRIKDNGALLVARGQNSSGVADRPFTFTTSIYRREGVPERDHSGILHVYFYCDTRLTIRVACVR